MQRGTYPFLRAVFVGGAAGAWKKLALARVQMSD
jgi:hypothetical protein